MGADQCRRVDHEGLLEKKSMEGCPFLCLEDIHLHFASVLIGGDQLTVALMRGTQALRDTEETPVPRLEGMVSVIEDWHAQVALLKVYFILHLTIPGHVITHAALLQNMLTCIERLYKDTLSNESGTMFQLRNLILIATDNFLLLLLHDHTIAATLTSTESACYVRFQK